MAKHEVTDDRCGLEEVQITIAVVQGPVQAALTKLSARMRAGLITGGLIAALAAVAVIALALSGGRAGQPLGLCPSGQLPQRIALELHLCR